MNDILQEIVAWKHIEVERQKESVPPHELYAEVERLMDARPFPPRSMRQSLANSFSGIIAEFKRRSPSKGWIKQEADATDIPPAYSKAGAGAVSILTDEKFFGGSLDDLLKARPSVGCPILRKDFIIDEYQLFQAKAVGADAVLLIAADLTPQQCATLAAKAHELGLETLLEIHEEKELDHVCPHIDMVGVNNRHLGTFHTDTATSFRLASLMPPDILAVSESGISNPETVRQLRQAGFRGFLVGETFMRTPQPAATLAQFIKEVEA